MTGTEIPLTDNGGGETKLLFNDIRTESCKCPDLSDNVNCSTIALRAFLTFKKILGRGTCTATDKEIIALAVSEVNGSGYCIAAHTMISKTMGISSDDIMLARSGHARTAKSDVVACVAKSIAENKGAVDPDLLVIFYKLGFGSSDLMEIVALVVATTFTNYVHAVTGIRVNHREPPAE